jgi:hypothetical protein
LFFCFFACRRKSNPGPSPIVEKQYDFSYTGSLYSGDTMYFQSTAAPTDKVVWFFGNILHDHSYSYGPRNEPCDSCGTVPTNAPYACDTSSASQCAHKYLNPGTYNITLTVNGNTVNRVKKTITIASPGAFASRIAVSRRWSRERYFYAGFTTPTDTAMSDTIFALAISPGMCITPHKQFPFYSYASSSSVLTYMGDPNYTHYANDGSVVWNRITDSVYIYEEDGWGPGATSISYRSGN